MLTVNFAKQTGSGAVVYGVNSTVLCLSLDLEIHLKE